MSEEELQVEPVLRRRSVIGTRIVAAVLGAVLTVGAGFLAFSRLASPVLELSYDLPFFAHGAGVPGDVCIVFLEDLSGEDLLDRGVQASLLDALNEAGAKAVVYDIIFDAPWADSSVDVAFAEAISRFRSGGESQREVFMAFGRKSFHQLGVDVEELIPPTDTLMDEIEQFGVVAYRDDLYWARELTTGTVDEPSLCWAVAAYYNEGLEEEDRLNERWINYPSRPGDSPSAGVATGIPSCYAKGVLDGDIPGEFFRDRIVFVGGAPGIVGQALGKDLFATPRNRLGGGSPASLMSGVELQATMTGNLMYEDWLSRLGRGGENLLVVLAGLVLGSMFVWLRPLPGVLVAVGVVLLLLVVGILTVHRGQVWIPWSAVAFFQVPMAVVWGTASHFYVERFFRMRLGEEQMILRKAFEKYLSPPMLAQLTERGFSTKLGGDKVEVAVMFTDISNFTQMCERTGDPERVVTNLNDYFERTTRHIFKNDGTVIKFIGDAILAGWGAPVADPDAVRKATRAAWNLYLNARFLMEGEELATRVGLHFGEVVAGNIGSSQHIDYTFIGDAVNLAARLQELNKLLGTSILMSSDVAEALDGEFRTRKVGYFQVVGRQAPTEVHELLGPEESLREMPWVATYHEALERLKGGDHAEARRLFQEVDETRRQGDGPSRFFLALEETLVDGVVVLTKK